MENKIKKLHEILNKLENSSESEFNLQELLESMDKEDIPMISFYNKNGTVVTIIRRASKKEAEAMVEAIGSLVKSILVSALELFNEQNLKDSEQSTKH